MRLVIAFLPAVSVCAIAASLQAGTAAAADLPSAPSSYPALNPDAADVTPNYWSGLVGAGVAAWGGKGVKGGVGGETDLTYEHVFDNGLMVGVQASTGYMPFVWSNPGFTQFSGSAFAGGSAIVGYNFGQVTPYVITGVDFARATRFGGGALNAGDAINSVFSSARSRRSEPSASASTIASIRISAWVSRRSFIPPGAAHSRRGREGAWRARRDVALPNAALRPAPSLNPE